MRKTPCSHIRIKYIRHYEQVKTNNGKVPIKLANKGIQLQAKPMAKIKASPPTSAIRLTNILKKLNPHVLLIDRPKTGHTTNNRGTIKALEFMLSPKMKQAEY